jgi:outer membrane receptor protein involved in Fe transport
VRASDRENLLDRAYRLHLSTLRGVVRLEPGRNWFLSATLAIRETD